jgi:polyprenyl-phospho-N-acetylgalactosaminyl synthase
MVSQAPRVCVVIAAYNEAPVIASVVADVRRAGYRALVVDDGSTDATGAVAAEAGCIVVRHSLNLGQGPHFKPASNSRLARGLTLS